MPIFKKWGMSIHFSHVPRTGGRSIMQAAERNGWKIDRFVDGDSSNVQSHPFFLEESERAILIPSFAIVRDPVDRFISATKHHGLCNNQDELVDLIRTHSSIPDTPERHFYPQTKFIGPHTHIYNYETQYDECIRILRFAGLVSQSFEMGRINTGSVLFQVDKESIRSELMKVKKWYLDDYRAFGYDPTSL